MRKLTFALFALAVSVALLTIKASAQTDIYISGAGRLFSIAVPQLCLESGSSESVKEVPAKVGKDLDLSGYFEVLNPDGYIESSGKCGGPEATVWSDWSAIGADHLVKGSVSSSGSRIRVRLYLIDSIKQATVLGKEYEGEEADAPMMAHRFANEIMQHFTGVYGPWGTKIAFSTKVGRFKELAVMDADGSNIRQLTNGKSLAVGASWHPNGEDLAFTSYLRRVPDLFMLNVFSRRVKQITSNTTLEIGPSFSKDGSTLLTAISEGGDSSIVVLGNNGAVLRRLTPKNGVIDVSGAWSPDERQIAFVSSRGGGPQIYTMGADGSNPRRVSFVTSNYCTSPAWSPKGDKIAFVCRADAGFQLFAANADGSAPLQLTSSGDNEDPSWAPDGRYITFASTFGRWGGAFSLALIRSDGANLRQLSSSRAGDSEPVWGPQLFRPEGR